MTRSIRVAALIGALTLSAARNAGAQATPPQPPVTAQPQPPAVTPPPAPAKIEIPERLRPPGDSDVALCRNGTWIKVPGVASDCSARGGLKVAMPPRRTPPPPPVRNLQPNFQTRAVPSGPPPENATARCKDGSYLFGTLPAESDPCFDRGGLAVRFPVRPPAPPAPRKPPER